MKVGDLVRWVGFPGADSTGVQITGPSCSGLVVKIYETGAYKFRVDVHWGDGTFGDCLYLQTIEVIDEPLTAEQSEFMADLLRADVLNERG